MSTSPSGESPGAAAGRGGGGPGTATGGVRVAALGAFFAVRGAAGLRGVDAAVRDTAALRGAREVVGLAVGRGGFGGTSVTAASGPGVAGDAPIASGDSRGDAESPAPAVGRCGRGARGARGRGGALGGAVGAR
jgi:hypothetical protein